MVWETLGYIGWKGAQDGVRGGILKVVPPLTPQTDFRDPPDGAFKSDLRPQSGALCDPLGHLV